MELAAPRPFKRVFLFARQALGMNQGDLAEALGISRRTVIRWQKGYTRPADFQVRSLATFVREVDGELADELLASANLEPEPAAIAPVVETPPPASAPPPAGPPPAHVIDAIVCAAADAADMSPRTMRPALRAAFARARDLGVSVDAALAGLGETS